MPAEQVSRLQRQAIRNCLSFLTQVRVNFGLEQEFILKPVLSEETSFKVPHFVRCAPQQAPMNQFVR